MPKVAVLDKTGKEVGSMELSDAVFGIEPNAVAMHELVVNYLANPRQGTQSALTRAEVLKYKTAMMVEFAVMDWETGWTQQFHYGAIRNNNSRMFKQLGADTGFDSIGDFTVGKSMAKFFDMLDREDKLTKTIIYNLNPRDNELVATMIGNFQDGRYGAGKIQFGSGWWVLDQKDGMEKQMNALSTLGLLSRFVGMLTDSRSFLSYPRHEYFRRTLCNLVGNDIENGLLPASEIDFIGREIIEGIDVYKRQISRLTSRTTRS